MSTKSIRQTKETRAAWAFLSPDLIGLALFIVLPSGLAFGMAFMSVSGFGAVRFAGFDNFARLLTDDKLPKALIVTFTYAILAVPLSYIVGLGLALLLEGKVRGGGLVRTMVFIPYVLSLVVVALIWQFMLVDKTGVVPTILRGVDLGHIKIGRAHV